jgi:hypothetical protein
MATRMPPIDDDALCEGGPGTTSEVRENSQRRDGQRPILDNPVESHVSADGFVIARARDAWATIRGFVYQVQKTILVALELGPNDYLELERGEDLDHVLSWNPDEGGPYITRLLQQIKLRQKHVTLHSAEAREAVVNFVDHLVTNQGCREDLRFRYVTNAAPGREANAPCLGGRKGIEVWEHLRSAQKVSLADGPEASCLFEIVKSWKPPRDLDTERWTRLHGRLVSDPNLFCEVIRRFEWGVESEQYEDMEPRIINVIVASGLADSNTTAEAAYLRLFVLVFQTLAREGDKVLRYSDVKIAAMTPLLHDDEVRSLVRSELLKLAASVDEVKAHIEKVEAKAELALTEIRRLTDAPPIDVTRGLPRIYTDPPPPPVSGIERNETIRLLVPAASVAWLALRGENGAGKTQLARQIAMRIGARIVWLRMRHLDSSQAMDHLAAALEILGARMPAAVGETDHAKSILVLDDLPDLSVMEGPADVLMGVAQAAENRLAVLSTSNFRLPHHLTTADIVCEKEIPPFTAMEIAAILAKLGAPGEKQEILARMVLTFSGGNGVLAVALCSFMRDEAWRDDSAIFAKLLGGAYMAPLEQETAKRVLATVLSDEARRLLYRLRLANGSFRADTVERVAQVPPPIGLAHEKLVELSGTWLQQEGQGYFSVSPLVRALPKELLPKDEVRACHATYAQAFLRGTVDQWRVMTIIAHLAGAEQFAKVATLLLQALFQLSITKQRIPDAGLLALWWTLPPPSTLPLGLRIQLRTAQIAAGIAYGKDVVHLEEDLESLLDQASAEEAWAIVAATIVSFHVVFPSRPAIAVRMMKQTVTVYETAILPNGQAVADQMPCPIDALFYIVTAGIRDRWHAESWLECVEAARGRVGSDWRQIEEGGSLICAKVFLAEFERPKDRRDWRGAETTLRKFSAFARAAGLEYMWAGAEAVLLSVRAEHLGERQPGLRESVEVLEQLKDSGARLFLIESISRQMLLANEHSAAGALLRDGFKCLGDARVESSTVISARLLAARCSMNEDASETATQARAAVAAAVAAALPPEKLARVYGDSSLAMARAGDLGLSFEFCAAGLRGLLNARGSGGLRWTTMFLGLADVCSRLACLLVFRREDRGFADVAPGRFLDLEDEENATVSDELEARTIVTALQVAEALGNSDQAVLWSAQGWATAKSANSETFEHLLLAIPTAAALQDSATTDSGLANLTGKYIECSKAHITNGVCAPEESAVLNLWIPIAWFLAATEQTGNARKRAEQLASIARAIPYRRGAPTYWSDVATVFQMCADNAPTRGMILFCNTQASQGRLALSGLACLLSLLGDDLTVVQAIQGQMLGLARGATVLLSGMAIQRLLLPYFGRFWTARCREERYRFSAPNAVDEEIRSGDPQGAAKVLRLLKTVAFSLGSHIPAELEGVSQLAERLANPIWARTG